MEATSPEQAPKVLSINDPGVKRALSHLALALRVWATPAAWRVREGRWDRVERNADLLRTAIERSDDEISDREASEMADAYIEAWKARYVSRN